jgi:hypothetical protein
MPANVWLLNLMVFGVLLEADLGRRKIGWFRVLRPLIAVAAIVPMFLTSLPTTGNNVAFQAAGVAAGALVGLASHLFVSVGFGPVKVRKLTLAVKGLADRSFSRAGFGYAAFWAVVFGARLMFIYGSYHWFPGPLGQFLVSHQVSAAGFTNALIFMAMAMALTRCAVLGARGRAATRRAAVAAAMAAQAAPGHLADAVGSERRTSADVQRHSS